MRRYQLKKKKKKKTFLSIEYKVPNDKAFIRKFFATKYLKVEFKQLLRKKKSLHLYSTVSIHKISVNINKVLKAIHMRSC